MKSKIDWDHLIQFIGYGPTHSADILFFGLSEAGGGHENLAARSCFDFIEDLFDAHEKKLKPAGVESPFDRPGNPVRQWNYASRIALCFRGEPSWFHAASSYWRSELGRKDGNTFLMEAFPFPSPQHGERIEGSPRWTDDEIWNMRRPILKRHLDSSPPRYVIAYGDETRHKAAELFGVDGKLDWRTLPGQSRRPLEFAFNGKTRIAHVGFFGQGYFSSADIPRLVSYLQHLPKIS